LRRAGGTSGPCRHNFLKHFAFPGFPAAPKLASNTFVVAPSEAAQEFSILIIAWNNSVTWCIYIRTWGSGLPPGTYACAAELLSALPDCHPLTEAGICGVEEKDRTSVIRYGPQQARPRQTRACGCCSVDRALLSRRDVDSGRGISSPSSRICVAFGFWFRIVRAASIAPAERRKCRIRKAGTGETSFRTAHSHNFGR